MMRYAIVSVITAIFVGAVSLFFFTGNTKDIPLVCSQISPSIKYARECTAEELKRIRTAHAWIVESFPPTLSRTSSAGIASFVADTGRRKGTEFYRRMSVHDVESACYSMMAHVNYRGELDESREKRRKRERDMCLSKD